MSRYVHEVHYLRKMTSVARDEFLDFTKSLKVESSSIPNKPESSFGFKYK